MNSSKVLDHDYVKDSIKIIDCLLTGKGDKIEFLGYVKQIYLLEVLAEKAVYKSDWVNDTI